MISKSELAKAAELKHLMVQNAEKDYLLEIMLYAVSDLRRFLVFKGGTALYKFYNLNRFSEDLDFDAVDKRFDIESLRKRILRNFELSGMQRTLYEIMDHGNEINIRLAVRGPLYDGSKESMSRVTLNLSKRERPTLIERKLFIPSYQDLPSFELSVLDVREITAEKIRCIMTREKPRDIYDLWFLCKRGTPVDISLVNKKLKIYGLQFDLEAFHEKIREKRNMWMRDLRDLVIGTLPVFDDVATELKSWSTKWK